MAWKELFGSAVGLASLLTIVGVIAIGYGFYRFISKKIDEEKSVSIDSARRRRKEEVTPWGVA